MLEVVLALLLAVFSGAFLVVCAVLPVYLLTLFGVKGGRRVGRLGIASLVTGIFLLKYPWNALLRYYRYEAHTLRPIKDETTNDRHPD